ncbi:MAG: insulinase family protein [Kiritimatiellae bacterium]|nr:insulinase family protein [Kiritimatiellia bacterium]
MKPGDVLHGFKVEGVQELDEVPAKMWRMTHVKSGADLAWLDRADDNKTFCIAFKTVPSDDTGVAHIMEHSVLCGSEKYPVKEPFVDLLKSSLQTFLNALTGADKTYYPVSSRNDKDFLNLMDVYLDAVLHPLSVKNPLALAQEGWHWEIAETEKDGKKSETLSRNGVVYSEMKGVFADPDDVGCLETMRLLFPNHCYGFESGGDPASIPDLTFEKYKDFHARFYHPSNARIFLDGRIDADATLAKLDSYLAPYDRAPVASDIPWQKPVSGKKTVPYEIGPDEDPANKFILMDGWAFGRYDDRERMLAAGVIGDLLAGSNASPLKKALLDAGLCEDVDVDDFAYQQGIAFITIRNVAEANVQKARALMRETLAKVAKEGFDRAQIEATLNRLEFGAREKDPGRYTRGLAFLHAALEGWCYGGDPAESFRYKKLFGALRAKIATGAFERHLKEIFIDNPHHAEVTLAPSKTIGEDRRRADEKALAEKLAGWSESEKARVKEDAAKLKAFQKSADKPEDVAKIPTLSRADVPVKGREIVREIAMVDGVEVVRPKVDVDGIFYLELHFDLAGLTQEEFQSLPLLATLLGELGTAKRDALALKTAVDGTLGRFAASARVFRERDTFAVCASALTEKRAEALALVREILLDTSFAPVKDVEDLLKQARQDAERDVANDGRTYAMRRAAARFTRSGLRSELLDGLAQVRWLQGADAAALADRYGALARKVFSRERLTIGVSDNVPLDFARSVVAAFPSNPTSRGETAYRIDGLSDNEGWVIPAAIGFAGRAGVLPADVKYHGSFAVATRILSLDYLWNEIRVLGGAYGMGVSVTPFGDVNCFTYRDPTPARSYEKFAAMGAALRKFADSDQPLDKYVVSAIGKMDPYLSPRLEVARAVGMHLNGRTPADEQREREETLATTKDDLRKVADAFDRMAGSCAACTVGGKDSVAACKPAKTESVAKTGK